jgi:hypothetical protein
MSCGYDLKSTLLTFSSRTPIHTQLSLHPRHRTREELSGDQVLECENTEWILTSYGVGEAYSVGGAAESLLS